MNFQRLQFHESRFWIWQVHENQSYLGRVVLLLKRDTHESCAHCTPEEWSDLRLQFQLYERFISSLFTPDRMNYGQLGNIFNRLHFHLVPRYETSRTWDGIEFHDHNWGKNWAPTPKSPLTEEQAYKFADWLREEFQAFLSKENVKSKSGSDIAVSDSDRMGLGGQT